MKGKSKLLFLICAFALTFLFAIEAKAACGKGPSTMDSCNNVTCSTYSTPGSCNGTQGCCVWAEESCDAGQYLDDGTCKDCPKGKKCAGGTAQPVACPAGTHQSSTGQSTCDSCDVGTYASGTGNTWCTQCGNGQYQDQTGQSSCKDCSGTVNASHTTCTITSCDAGKYLDSGTCKSCPAGSYCSGGTSQPIECAAGTYSSGGARECSQCYGSKQYSGKGASSCSTCPDGKVPNSAHTACVDESTGGCGEGQGAGAGMSSSTGCGNCSAGTYSPANDDECHKCTGNTISSAGASSCSACPTGKVANDDHTACENEKCGAGLGADKSATTGCSSCAAGRYSPANDDECHKCPSGQISGVGASSCTDVTAPCCVYDSNGARQTIDDLSGCQYATSHATKVTNGACPVADVQTVSKVIPAAATTVYLNAAQDADGDGFHTVIYIAYDQNGDKMKAENMGGWTVVGNSNAVKSSSANGGAFTVTYKGLGCDEPNATLHAVATDKQGNSVSSANITIVTKYTKWSSPQSWNKPKPEGREIKPEAWRTSYCDAYDGYDAATGTYKYRYWRCCGPSTTEEEVDKCYKDKTTGLFTCGKHASETSRYTYIADDCDSAACKNPTEPVKACYKNTETGEFKFDFKTSLPDPDKWKFIDLDEEHCKPEETQEEPACFYKEGSGKYFWGKYDGVAGYVLTALSMEECVNPEPKCYKHKKTGEYVWGIYDTSLYEEVASITDEKKCKIACYKCADDEYKWGTPVDYPDCELVPNITTQDSCKPVPVTGSSVSKIIYAISLFLIMAGSGIVVYQLTKTKRELN